MEKMGYYFEISRYIEDIADLTQQVFLKYYQAKSHQKNVHNPKAYLLGTARIIIADYYRKKILFQNIDLNNQPTIEIEQYPKIYDPAIDGNLYFLLADLKKIADLL